LQGFAAWSASGLLGGMGVPNQLSWQPDGPHILLDSADAAIQDVCSAALEVAVIMAVVLASWGVPWRERLWGAALGALLALLFNPLRIAVTLLAFHTTGPQLTALFHDWLFRASLLVFIFIYYASWYVYIKPKAKR